MSLAAGTTLGPYEIIAPLGEGGMGEVYLARDRKLDRDVALKLLPTALEANSDAVERFHREARAVAALNHPNIVTIYGVDDADGRAFLAMELVDGTTLGARIPKSGMPLDDVLKYAIPLADALAAAHEQGVAHRDLKPANIMVARDGRVKVLDFGLAKLRADTADVGETRTAADLTGEGKIVGTVAYMSPEQASGEPVDTRTDLFSLGILLYEMATGQRPFAGDSGVKVLAAILKDTPRPVTELQPTLPREFARIVRRALAKDPEERYQTAKDLRNDLRALKADLTSGELSAPDVVPAKRGGPSAAWLALAAAVVVVAAIAGYALWSRPAPQPAEQATLTQSRLTTTGTVARAAVSPDGRVVAYVRQDGAFSLWARQTATGSEIELVPAGPDAINGVTISPDADYVYFIRQPGNIRQDLYRVPVLGGTPELIRTDVDSAVTFSPDGARIAFLRGVASTSTYEVRLLSLAADGSGEAETMAASSLFGGFSMGGIAWSPDGDTVAAAVGDSGVLMKPSGALAARIVLVDVATGAIRDASPQRWSQIMGVSWLADDVLVVSGTESDSPNPQLWRVELEGPVDRLTSDLGSYAGVTVARDTGAIVTTVGEMTSTISVWTPGAESLTPVTTGRGRIDGRSGLAWTRDGRVVYTSTTAGSQVDLWISADDGTSARQLTSNAAVESGPFVSPDDQYVVYKAGPGQGLARSPLAGGRPRPVTSDPWHLLPVVLADGETVQFIRFPDAPAGSRPSWEIGRVGIEGGDATVVATLDSPVVEPSPDGRYILAFFDWEIGLMPTDGTPPDASFDVLDFPIGLAMNPAGDVLTFLRTRADSQGLWNQQLDGSPPEMVLDVGLERIYNFVWSFDGRLAVAHGPVAADVVVITGAR